MKKTWLAAAAAVLFTCSSASFAQWAVFDAANYSQNLLTAARELQQIDNQIQQLQNEATMLVNQGRNLTSLNYNSLSQLLSTLATTNQLISQAQGLTFNVAQSQATFNRLYPGSYSAGTLPSDPAGSGSPSDRWAARPWTLGQPPSD